MFDDADRPDWAEKEITALAEKNIVNGVAPGKFEPNRDITRAEFTKLIVTAMQLEKADTVPAFEDVQGLWSQEYIETAASLGIVTGYDGMFLPEDCITREEMAAILYRTMQAVNPEDAYLASELSFQDREEISPWAEEAIAFISEKEIVKGMEDQTFAPKQNATRAQAAVVIYRLMEYLDK